MLLSTCLTTLVFSSLVLCQAPNPLYKDYPSFGTQSFNTTVFVVTLDKTVAQGLTSGYPLLPVPKSVFPNGFPEGKHPIVVQVSYLSDIRQFNLQIPQLSSATILVPFVDRLGDGKTYFTRQYKTYLDQIIPTLVGGTLDNTNTALANFDPPHAAWKSLGPGHLAASVGQGIQLPDGPGLDFYAIDTTFEPTPTQIYPASTYKKLLSYRIYAPLGCANITSFFGYSYEQPFFVNGIVTLYQPMLASTTVFRNVPGLSLSGAELMDIFPPKPCV